MKPVVWRWHFPGRSLEWAELKGGPRGPRTGFAQHKFVELLSVCDGHPGQVLGGGVGFTLRAVGRE